MRDVVEIRLKLNPANAAAIAGELRVMGFREGLDNRGRRTFSGSDLAVVIEQDDADFGRISSVKMMLPDPRLSSS